MKGAVTVHEGSLSGVSLSRQVSVQRVSLREIPPHCEQTGACKNITLPQTLFAGGKNVNRLKKFWQSVLKVCLQTAHNVSKKRKFS